MSLKEKWVCVAGMLFAVCIIFPMIYSRMKLSKPFAASWEHWEAWHSQMQLRHPIRYFFTESCPTFFGRLNRRCRDAYYWVRNSIWDRHNVIVCRKLPPTWSDRDHRMLHACFQLLTDFVDLEKPWEFSATKEEMLEAYKDCDWAGERIEDWQELRELYQWWQKREETGQKYEIDQLMLTRLIKHRRLLWT